MAIDNEDSWKGGSVPPEPPISAEDETSPVGTDAEHPLRIGLLPARLRTALDESVQSIHALPIAIDEDVESSNETEAPQPLVATDNESPLQIWVLKAALRAAGMPDSPQSRAFVERP